MVFNNLALQLLPKMLSVNQAETFFDQQYLGEETIDILLFLHRDLQEMSQMQVAPGTVTFDWVRPVLSVVESDYNILGSAVSLERTNEYLRFFSMEIIIKGR